MKEIWKDIPNYEGFYQASNMGRIRSINRVSDEVKSDGTIIKRKYKGKIISPNINNRGYMYLCLCKNRKHLYAKVHRLIAITFLQNPNSFTDVNHKDGNKENNCVSNLEWCSHSENQKHALREGLNKIPYAAGRFKKSVIQISATDGSIIHRFESIAAATRYFGRTNPTNIGNVLRGRTKTAYGYKWKFYG